MRRCRCAMLRYAVVWFECMCVPAMVCMCMLTVCVWFRLQFERNSTIEHDNLLLVDKMRDIVTRKQMDDQRHARNQMVKSRSARERQKQLMKVVEENEVRRLQDGEASSMCRSARASSGLSICLCVVAALLIVHVITISYVLCCVRKFSLVSSHNPLPTHIIHGIQNIKNNKHYLQTSDVILISILLLQ
jgi:hypothetical protein